MVIWTATATPLQQYSKKQRDGGMHLSKWTILFSAKYKIEDGFPHKGQRHARDSNVDHASHENEVSNGLRLRYGLVLLSCLVYGIRCHDPTHSPTATGASAEGEEVKM